MMNDFTEMINRNCCNLEVISTRLEDVIKEISNKTEDTQENTCENNLTVEKLLNINKSLQNITRDLRALERDCRLN